MTKKSKIKILLCASFFSINFFSSGSENIPEPPLTCKTHSGFDIEFRTNQQEIDGCTDVPFVPQFWVLNQSSGFVNDIDLLVINGKDTTIENHGIYLNPGDSTRVQLRKALVFGSKGVYKVQLNLDTIDDNIINNKLDLTFRIQDPPIASFIHSDICGDKEITFESTTTYDGQDTLQYSWFFGNGTRAESAKVKHRFLLRNPSMVETFRVTLRAYSKGCEDTYVKDISLQALPDPSFEYELNDRDLSIIYLAHTDPNALYLWEFGDGKRSTKIAPTHTYEQSGDYDVCLTVISQVGCIATTCVLPADMAYIEGRVYVDLDSNCSFDTTDIGLETIISTEGLSFSRNSNPAGLYNMTLFANDDYKVLPQIPPLLRPVCNTETFEMSDAIVDSTYHHDFIFEPIPESKDISVRVGTNLVQRGRSTTASVIVETLGYASIDSAELEFKFDSRLKVKSGSYPFTLKQPGVITMKIGAPDYYKSKQINIKLTDPMGKLMLGDTATFIATIKLADDIKSNNTDTSKAIVVTPYDPNAKTSFPSGALAERVDEVSYIIEFQNIGNADAKDVVVYDYLDERLPVTGIKVTGTSHPDQYQLSIHNNVLKWTFSEIYLPDSTSDQEGSKGFISYNALVSDGFRSPGDSIHNMATIYFDFEDGIETNTASIYIDDKSSVATYIIDQINIYPNPVSVGGMVSLDLETELVDAALFKANGQAFPMYFAKYGKTVKFAAPDSPGMYIVLLKTENGGNVQQKLFVY